MKRTIGILLVLFVAFTMSFGMAGSAYAASRITHLEKSTMYVTLGGGITQHLLTASGKTIKASKVTWTTSNKKIATVSKSGKVTGKKVTTSKTGPVMIKAKYKGKTYKCKAYVKYATKKYSSISLKVGDTAKQIIYAASGNPASTSKVKFTVEKGKENIATVNNEGLITAVSEGTVKIYAEYFGVKYKATVSVSPNEQKQEEQKEEEKKEESQQQQPATPPAGGGTSGGAGGGSTPSGGGESATDTPTKPTEPEIIKYIVSFNSNGGTGNMSSKEIEKDKEYKLPNCTFTAPSGKEFKAWKIDNKEYKVGQSLKITKNTAINAVWQEKTKDYTEYTYKDYDAMGKTEQRDFMIAFCQKYGERAFYTWYDSIQAQKAKDNKEKESSGSIVIE